jgi:DNA polymerase III alpha subunit
MLTNDNINSLVEGVLKHGPEILDLCVSNSKDLEQYKNRIYSEFLNYEIPQPEFTGPEWLIPNEYKTMDIEKYLESLCPKENLSRMFDELKLFKQHNMLMLLRTMKFIVDTLRKNNITWGVGRGSSVASYVLFLIGVHKIDPIKYELPIEEFFKGEQNG